MNKHIAVVGGSIVVLCLAAIISCTRSTLADTLASQTNRGDLFYLNNGFPTSSMKAAQSWKPDLSGTLTKWTWFLTTSTVTSTFSLYGPFNSVTDANNTKDSSSSLLLATSSDNFFASGPKTFFTIPATSIESSKYYWSQLNTFEEGARAWSISAVGLDPVPGHAFTHFNSIAGSWQYDFSGYRDSAFIAEGTSTVPSLTGLSQYKSDATTTIAGGASTTESYVVFGATLNTGTTSTLEVEVEPALTSFTGIPNATSSPVSSGSSATAVFGTSTLVYPRDPESWSNGDFHWQARTKNSNGVTSTWQLFGANTSSTDFKINTVPIFMQKYGPWPSYGSTTDWHSNIYFDGTVSCGGGNTIGYCGCAISTVAMWLRYSGVATDTLSEDVNPGTLNTWLTNNGGYDVDGNLKWEKVTGYASSTSGAIVYDINSPNYGTSTSALRPYVDANINSSTPNPVILRENGNDHFVIATGIASNAGTSTYTIRDSALYNTKYLNQATSTETSSTIYGYGNNIDRVRIYYDPPQAPVWGEYHVNLPNALMLVDASGRRTGKDPMSSVLYHEIPGTAYDEEYAGTSHGVGELFTTDLPGGQYNLYVLGGRDGPYWLDASHSGQQDEIFRGNIQIGSMAAYLQKYDATNVAGSTMSYQNTYPSVAIITSDAAHNLPPPAVPKSIELSPPPGAVIIAPSVSETSTSVTTSTSGAASSTFLHVATSSIPIATSSVWGL